ncbi:MAG: nucleotidyltransferase family protein, partial [Spirochaetales bacterium]|nr:nucleotidyltransferase family protein [Spirochaetales bacterium]
MALVNTVILAGDKKGSVLVGDDNKSFLSINNIPSIIHTLKAFLEANYVGNIVVVGPADRLRKVIGNYNLPLGSIINVIEQKETLIENGKAGCVAAMEGVSEGTPFESLYETEYTDISVIVAPCDIPLITPSEIDEFIEKADMEENDFYLGLCREDVLDYYYPGSDRPGIRMNYLHMKEGNFRINNLHILKPLKIERHQYIEKMYELRYQKHFLNMFKLLIEVLFNGRGVIRGLYYALKLQLVSICFDKGPMRLYWKIKNSIEINKILKGIGRILGTRISYISTSYGGAALDVDHEADRKIVEEMYDTWM